MPRITLGMPVYNGAKHIRETLDSILAQTVTDFRLVISDNASTDTTGEICREYAQRDDRIRYYRQSENLGFVNNFNFVFQPEGSPYFKWVAHDDLLKPTYLQRCLELLEQDDSLSMAHCITLQIDEQSQEIGKYNNLRLSGDRVRDRFWAILWTIDIYEVYGVMRSDLLTKTQLAGNYVGSERTMLAKMLLQGNIGYVEEGLFSRRDHAGAQTAIHIQARNAGNYAVMRKCQAPKSKVPRVLAPVVRFGKYLEAISMFSMPVGDRLACLKMLTEWVIHRTVESATGNTERYRYKFYADLWAAEPVTTEQGSVEPQTDAAEEQERKESTAALLSGAPVLMCEATAQLTPFAQPLSNAKF
ncbi:glycosyltransferase [Leptolyngbya sp. FACHB-1515]|uniref:glycosyltransferase family 2 protein n=1 Tax=Leptolyngbya sp. FACHB-1515 TaxID=2933931 RepID=UPI00329970D1